MIRLAGEHDTLARSGHRQVIASTVCCTQLKRVSKVLRKHHGDTGAVSRDTLPWFCPDDKIPADQAPQGFTFHDAFAIPPRVFVPESSGMATVRSARWPT